jgi:hypothetical protein
MKMMTLRTGVASCGARLCRSSLSIPFLFLVAMAPAFADTNSWTKPGNGFWEEQTYWSLGVLPDPTQQILFDNAGLKALVIGPQTAQNFPQSLSVASLRVGAPADSYNVLMLALAGFEQPLQTGSLAVEPNGAVVMQGSSLVVLADPVPYIRALSIGGSFSQGDSSQVTAFSLGLKSGSYFLTNGTLTVNSLLEDWGNFVQYGGENNAGRLHVEENGEYHLYNGQVQGFLRISDRGSFFQYGGDVAADVDVGFDYTGGLYVMSGGTLTGTMTVPSARGSGAVQQSGGTNFAASLAIGNGSRFGGWGSYVLSNGVVAVRSSTTLRALGTFDQWDGLHTIASNLVMTGSDLGSLGGIANASYSLRGGTLSATTLTMWIATFEQDRGSNLISGDVIIGPPGPFSNTGVYASLYTLDGGFLSASNLTINGSFNGGNIVDSGGFDQAGGTNIISSDLRIMGQAPNFHGYTLTAGNLSVNNISISNGAAFYHNGGGINHTGVLTLAGGSWQARPGEQTLGPMVLASGDVTNTSDINFPAGASVLRLANSSGKAWSPAANLYINNWHGSASGGGETQLVFGTGEKGLTHQQLALIKFSLPGGLYPARCLATGEVVPRKHPSSAAP